MNDNFIQQKKKQFRNRFTYSFVETDILKHSYYRKYLQAAIEQFLEQALQQQKAELIKSVSALKRKDTDPLHSYMPNVWNEALDKAIEKLKDGD